MRENYDVKEDLTPRQRWLAVLRKRIPDRVPLDYWATNEVTKRLMAFLGCRSKKDLFLKLHIDAAISVGPKYVGPPILEDSDVYGCRYRKVRYGKGENSGVYRECVYHPLAKYRSVNEIKQHYRWPDVDLYDYTVIEDQISGWKDYPIIGGGSEPFLIYKHLRGETQAYIDLIRNPDMVHYCLDKLFDFCYENTKLIYEAASGKVMISYIAEDFGSQTGLLYSPRHIREFFIPRMKRMIDLAHHYGVYAFFHSDGAIGEIVSDMIKVGIDILNPIQWRCRGMDRESLKRDFGDLVVFHGGVDNQYTLAFGSEMEVREEVRSNIQILGRNGGYILAPCHNIQTITPLRNIIAMYEEGYRAGIYL